MGKSASVGDREADEPWLAQSRGSTRRRLTPPKWRSRSPGRLVLSQKARVRTCRTLARCSLLLSPRRRSRARRRRRSLRHERDHRDSDRGAIALDGERSRDPPSRRDRNATDPVIRAADRVHDSFRGEALVRRWRRNTGPCAQSAPGAGTGQRVLRRHWERPARAGARTKQSRPFRAQQKLGPGRGTTRRQEIVKTVMLFCARSSISFSNVLIHDSPAEALGRRWGRYSESSQPGRRNR